MKNMYSRREKVTAEKAPSYLVPQIVLENASSIIKDANFILRCSVNSRINIFIYTILLHLRKPKILVQKFIKQTISGIIFRSVN